MSREKTMEKVNEQIDNMFTQIAYEGKIMDGSVYAFASNFKDLAINLLFDEFSHGKTSPECKQKCACVRRDLYRVINSDNSEMNWRQNIVSLAESDVGKKIIKEHLHTHKWQYRDEFVQKALEIFKEIKMEIHALITLYIFRGNTVDLEVFFK